MFAVIAKNLLEGEVLNGTDPDKLAREEFTSWRVSREGAGQLDLETMGISLARESL
jgi:beta-fructofuranosidase